MDTGRQLHPWEREALDDALPELRESLCQLRTPPLHGLLPGDPAPFFGPHPGALRRPSPKPLPANLSGRGVISRLARELRQRKITSVELTQNCLARLREGDEKLHCVISFCEERALKEAQQADDELSRGIDRGPLHGIPYGLKDLFAATGAPTTFGAEPYKNQTLDFESAVSERLSEAGAVLVAKLSLGELAFGDDWFGGKTRTPWDLEKGSSGSSAGSAAAVSAGLVPFAIGTETFGSIVSPSVRCGTVGFRPTFGRISRFGAMALSWSMDKVGPLCRTVADAATVFSALHGGDPRDPSSHTAPFRFRPRTNLNGVKLGVDTKSPPDDETLSALIALGATLTPLELPDDPTIFTVAWRTIQVEAAASFAELIEDGERFEKLQKTDYRDWRVGLRCGALIPATEYLQAQRLRRRFFERLEATLSNLDGYVTVPWGESTSLPLTNLTGHPELILQNGLDADGLPRMLSFVGRLDRDDKLLSIASAFEKKRPACWPPSPAS
jgi:Asp-tRNA(Asn)/Glu-tRNA(Gln) amidotransferase A subunit family amidase